jgi:pyruvate-formate lyase-activating enzyme
MSEEKKPGICNVLMYTMFPSSDAGVQHEISQIGKDLEKIHSDLSSERSIFAYDLMMYRKLKDTTTAMDTNGMTRSDAIKGIVSKMNLSRTKIKALERQVNVFSCARSKMESTHMNANMDNTIKNLKKRMVRVKAIDPDEMVRNLDDIAESGKDIDKANDTINDALVSAWDTDVDVGEEELMDYINSLDAEDIEASVEKTEEDIAFENEVNTPMIEQREAILF